MKTIVSFLIAFSLTTSMMAQSEKYTESMKSGIESLYASSEASGFDESINFFQRIGQVEKEQWEPQYYAAFGMLMKTSLLEDNAAKDDLLDRALETIKLAGDISPNNSEILAMEGYILMMKLTLDAATRGQTLSPRIMELFSKAMAIDASNPRATLLMAQMQMGTAKFFGTDMNQPCGLVERAVQLFDTNQPASPIAPAWGKNMALGMQNACSSAMESKGEK